MRFKTQHRDQIKDTFLSSTQILGFIVDRNNGALQALEPTLKAVQDAQHVLCVGATAAQAILQQRQVACFLRTFTIRTTR